MSTTTTPTPSATLREQLAQKNDERPEHCIEDGNGVFIEFLPSPHLRVGYGTSQLLHYQLATKQPDLADDPTKQPQLLTLGFATADVIISGQRLELVCQKIGNGSLARVRTLAERYAALVPTTRPFIGKIEIKPVKGHGAED
jgi:hypothetical protein